MDALKYLYLRKMAPKKAPKKPKLLKPKAQFKPLTRYTDKTAHERMALIRQQNVEHHASYAGTLGLRRNILKHQQNATYQNEIDKLTHGALNDKLHSAAMERLGYLENMVNR
jgi:hypothetical protein